MAISMATSLKVDPLITFGRLDTHVGPNENKHIQFIGTKILFLVSNFHIMNMVIYQFLYSNLNDLKYNSIKLGMTRANSWVAHAFSEIKTQTALLR